VALPHLPYQNNIPPTLPPHPIAPSAHRWVHGLDEQLPLRVLPPGDRVIQILRGVAVVAATQHNSLILQQELDACSGGQVDQRRVEGQSEWSGM
jgi:hypothetical protein